MSRESVVTITLSEYRRLIEADVKNKIFIESAKDGRYWSPEDIQRILGVSEYKPVEVVADVADDF